VGHSYRSHAIAAGANVNAQPRGFRVDHHRLRAGWPRDAPEDFRIGTSRVCITQPAYPNKGNFVQSASRCLERGDCCETSSDRSRLQGMRRDIAVLEVRSYCRLRRIICGSNNRADPLRVGFKTAVWLDGVLLLWHFHTKVLTRPFP
jgi:hypothetical protein